MVLLLMACGKGKNYKNEKIMMEAFSDMKTPVFVLDLPIIQHQLADMASRDKGSADADQHVREYYRDGGLPLWIDKTGADHRADTLLSWLRTVSDIGMKPRSFGIAAIEQDLQRLRTLDLDDKKNTAAKVAARLEYALTKACLQYAYGQHFGFVNPQRTFNHLQVQKQDSTGRVLKYHGLFDVDIELPDSQYRETVFRKIVRDSLATYLRDIQPRDKFYQQLKKMLASEKDEEQRRRILCNMERCRWERLKPLTEEGKRIVVNIPAFHLYAYGPDSVLDMKVVCGANSTRTPQLSSEIERMEVNPQWSIPMSIISKDVAHHAGDPSYFSRRRYRIYDSSGKQVSAENVSRQMMLSGKYRVAQDGGAGNSLGRIVFRFKNKFSVYLHDTSNPGAFNSASRALSHGCVRVSKPYDLAHFMLDDPDEWLLDRIHISMGLGAMTDKGRQYLESHPGSNHRLVNHVPVEPRVPLYIIYNTIWPDQHGVIQTWPDVYGYDKVLWEHLKTYMQ